MDLDLVWDETKTALSEAYRDLVGFAIAGVEALAIVVVATFVARALRGRTRRAVQRTTVGPNVAALAANAVGVGVYVLAASLVLGLLGADWTAVLAFLSVGTLAVSLAVQDVLRNFVAGVYLLLERPFSIGDRIRLRDVEGKVESIEARTTVLRTAREERVLVPNATVFAEILTNRFGYDTAQTTATLKGITTPIADLPAAVEQALAGLPELRGVAPRTVLTEAGADGTAATVTISHAAEADLTAQLIARLRERFPEATIAAGAP